MRVTSDVRVELSSEWLVSMDAGESNLLPLVEAVREEAFGKPESVEVSVVGAMLRSVAILELSQEAVVLSVLKVTSSSVATLVLSSAAVVVAVTGNVLEMSTTIDSNTVP